MQCQNHPKKEAIGACVNCGNFFCADCLIKVKNKNHCKSCTAELLGDSDAGKRQTIESKPIIFQQQQQQTGFSTSTEKAGEPFNWQPIKTIVKWLIGLGLLVATVSEFSQKYYLAGILTLVLGLYWIPPIQSSLHRLLKEKYQFTIPGWARNLVSLILFFIIVSIKF